MLVIRGTAHRTTHISCHQDAMSPLNPLSFFDRACLFCRISQASEPKDVPQMYKFYEPARANGCYALISAEPARILAQAAWLQPITVYGRLQRAIIRFVTASARSRSGRFV